MRAYYLTILMLVFMSLRALAQQTSICLNADFELGDFTNWSASTGNCCPLQITTPGLVNGRHTIMTGTGADKWSLGLIPFIPPGGGTYTARLGNDQVGSRAEQLTYAFTVTPNNALFIYRYAVVLQDPGHPTHEQPRFSFPLPL